MFLLRETHKSLGINPNTANPIRMPATALTFPFQIVIALLLSLLWGGTTIFKLIKTKGWANWING